MALKAAVIGTGAISEEHLSFLQASPNAELVGVCDLSRAAACYAVDRFGGEPYTDLDQMIERVRPDVVHILTPPRTHEQIAARCLDAGAHVVCEKPLTLSTDALDVLWQKSCAAGRALVEDHNYRFNQPVLAIEQLIEEGVLGDIVEVEVRMHLGIRGGGGRYDDPNLPHPSHQLPCGVLHEFVSHLGYLLLRFTGGFDHVRAAWRNHGGGDLYRYDDLDALLMHKRIHGRLRFSAYAAPDTFTLLVRGSEGFAQTDLFQPHLSVFVPRAGGGNLSPMANQIFNGLGLAKAGCRNIYDKVMQRSPYEGLHRLMDRVYEALLEGKRLPITYEDMRGVSLLIDALLAEENRL